MRNWILIAAACATSATAVPPKKPVARAASKPAAKGAPAVWYDFHGAKLGMTIAEWKAMTPPVRRDAAYSFQTVGDVVAICTNDGDPQTEHSSFYSNKDEQAAGVVLCGYRIRARYDFDQAKPDYRPAEVMIGDRSTDYVIYKFLDGKLYEIVVSGPTSLVNDVLDGLVAKFGPPSSEINDTVHNKLGGTFDRARKRWFNPVASINFETPWSEIGDFGLVYSANGPTLRLENAKLAAHPYADKM